MGIIQVALTVIVATLFSSLFSFGCKRRGVGTGIIYNDEMADFGIPGADERVTEDLPNAIAPGKRPMSSMCPVIVVNERDEVELILGTAGGPRITTTNAFVSHSSPPNTWLE
jgi:gamma-glutamyltranspeptidase/glutathione hydrolase/leukotriene-C4 hydrolase